MQNKKKTKVETMCGNLPQVAAVVVTTKGRSIATGFPVVALDMVCGNCGACVNREDKYCNECGARFRERFDI